jgi:N-acetylgalactosamine-6-sulfatase
MFSSDNGPERTGAKPDPKKTDPDAKVTGYDTYYSVGETGGLRGRKRSVFEGGVRVPFIVRWPGHTPAGMKNETTSFTAVDLLPTLCAAANVKLPDNYQGDGENLFEALNGKVINRTRPIFWEWLGTKTDPDYWPRLVVRDGDWKLALADEGKRVELHNITTDRAEKVDLAKENPEIVARLRKLALDWKATLPTKPTPECLTSVPEPMKPMSANAQTTNTVNKDRAIAFDRWDTNQDDVVTLAEYLAAQKPNELLEARFKRLDKNSDGKLTKEEFNGPIAK